MIKKHLKIILSIAFMFAILPHAYAFDVSITGAPRTEDQIDTGGKTEWKYVDGDDGSFKCSYKVSTPYTYKVTINALDINNEQLIYESSTPAHNILAGTYLKLNIFETRTFSWNYYINKTFKIRKYIYSYENTVTKYECKVQTCSPATSSTASGSTNSGSSGSKSTGGGSTGGSSGGKIPNNRDRNNVTLTKFTDQLQLTETPSTCTSSYTLEPVSTSTTYISDNSNKVTITKEGKTSTYSTDISSIKCSASNEGATITEYKYTGKSTTTTIYVDTDISKVETEYTEYIDECRRIAATTTYNLLNSYYNEPTFDMYLPDSNSISGTDTLYINAKDSTHDQCEGGILAGNGSCSIDINKILEVGYENTTYGTEDTPVRKYAGNVDNHHELKRIYEYNPKVACLNTKTAKVTYNNEKCSGTNEIQINPIEHTSETIGTKTYWPYFTPLDAKNDNKITIKYVSTKGEENVLNNEKCQYVIRHNPVFFIRDKDSPGMYNLQKKEQAGYDSYENYLSPENVGETFNCTSPSNCYSYCIVGSVSQISSVKAAISSRNEGSNEQIKLPAGVTCYGIYSDKDNDKVTEKNKNLSKYEGTCKMQVLVSFPMSQKFYNEEEKTSASGQKNTIFKGFNFYYRPIDINNPFPNPTSPSVLWSKYQESTNSIKTEDNKTINFSNSYKEITYYTTNITQIRNDFNDIKYTDWTNIYPDGTNSYIDSNKTIIRNAPYDGYTIGCGPKNSLKYQIDNNGTITSTENPLYLPYCGGETT